MPRRQLHNTVMKTLEVTAKTARGGVKVSTGKRTTIQVRMAAIEILVGGPYKDKKGKDHPYGHVALRVTTGEVDHIFDYGRYGREWGFGDSEGEGMLRVWTDFSAYISSENSYGRKTKAFTYEVLEEKAKDVLKHFEKKIEGKSPTKKSRPPKMKEYQIEDYYALGPNCTTMSVDGAKIALPKIDNDRVSFRQGRGLSFTERSLANLRGWPEKIVMPGDLQAMLEANSAIKPKQTQIFEARR